jgi:predicted nucleic acid-binding protein
MIKQMSRMSASIPKTILIDTGFWFAIYDKRDQYHEQATAIFNQIESARILIPWPTLYEVMNSDFVGERIWVESFEKFLKRTNVERIDDSKYKELALEDSVNKSVIKGWSISLVDSVIRQILSDIDVKIEYFLTFNQGDFIDIIKKRPTTQFYYS